MHNILQEFKRTIELDVDIEEQLKEVLFDEYFYSYLVYVKCDEFGVIKNYFIKFMIAQEDSYNTINKDLAVNHILDCIEIYKEYLGETKIIGYKQPPLDMMIALYEPLMYDMARHMQQYWKQFEVEDLLQMCRISMCELYNKGYYIHKRLLWTAFKNKIIEEIRPLKRRGELVSLQISYCDKHGGEENLSLADIMPDLAAEEQQEEESIHEANLQIFAEIKDIIIDLVGPRQFDMLFRDYSRGHTTPQSRKLLIKIKNHLNSMGITQSQFNEKYHRKGK